MAMKKLIIFATMCLFLVVCLASFSQSAPIPDLKGVWSGTATAAWARGGGPGSTPPVGQKFMDYTISITITDQNQDLVLGKVEVRPTVGPIDNPNSPGPSVSTDFGGVVYGGNELHFCIGDPTGPIGFGKLSLPPPMGTKIQTISGHWVGSLQPAIPFQGTAARFSVSKKTMIPPPTPGGK
jgi:hypothetical protein